MSLLGFIFTEKQGETNIKKDRAKVTSTLPYLHYIIIISRIKEFL